MRALLAKLKRPWLFVRCIEEFAKNHVRKNEGQLYQVFRKICPFESSCHFMLTFLNLCLSWSQEIVNSGYKFNIVMNCINISNNFEGFLLVASETTQQSSKNLCQFFSIYSPYCLHQIHSSNWRSSHQRCFIKKSVLTNFTKFTGKHLCQSLILNKVAGLRNNFL